MAHKNRSNWSPYKARKEEKGEALGPTSRAAKPAHGVATPARSAGHVKPGAPRAGNAKPALRGQAVPTPASRPTRSDKTESVTGGGDRHRRSTENYSFNEADDRMYSVFRNHGFGDYPHAKRQELTRFYQLLMENQGKENFTRLLNLRDVAIKHFIDSLIVTRFTKLKFPLLDMGTGPGFPGIPLAIDAGNVRPSKAGSDKKTIILAEGVQRRVEFLKHARESLGVEQLPIIGRNINSECFYPVQGVITRAVEDARNTLGNVIHCVQTGGSVYLMKGPNCAPEIPVALDTWGEYFKLEQDVSYELPNSPNQRRLLVFTKLKPAPLPDFEELDLAWERENGAE